ncbi:3-ketoacyl-CoA thiolase @ Acetyl-CoA acetyltransferase [hydrothermal vent metagenome]|uniref:3-ketoacyl-CoA thiolase @ Acetyl-CoA acetyltransferase n=1 Tax=hydrothermal vent metagenome TaxID=652676 RepID=A0A3B0TAS9_9ZZZZ
MTDAYIYDYVKTPRGRGKPNGSLHEVTPIDLLTQILKALKDRNAFDPRLVDDIITGTVSPVAEQGSVMPRFAGIMAGYGHHVPGVQLDRFCSSGLVAVNYAAARIMSGQSDLIIGSGVEAMSRVPMGSDGGAWAVDPQTSYAIGFAPQGIGADLMGNLYGFSREDCDAFAVQSQQRAKAAWDKGHFDKSLVVIKDKLGLTVLDHDEHMRPEATMEALAGLKPSFADMGEFGFDSIALKRYPHVEKITHIHHAGNASGIVDGAAGILIGTKEMGETLGLKPRARFVGFADIGSEPVVMLDGPGRSAQKALKRAGMTTNDIDVWEINEAFASVALRFMQELDLDQSNVNVNGGSIAMGHPLGATGAIILGTALEEMERSDKSTALASLCVGGGMATATIIERV